MSCSGGDRGPNSLDGPTSPPNIPDDKLEVPEDFLTDFLEPQLWHLENTGQKNFSSSGGKINEDIRGTQTHEEKIYGQGIVIAISDNGVEITHEDLAPNVRSELSRNYSSSNPANWAGGDPSPDNDNEAISAHGTAVAGLAAARGGNTFGTRGVAPYSQIAAFKFIGTAPSLTKDIDQAFGPIDIFNYSYGRSTCSFIPVQQSYLDQLKFGALNLRGGKGAFYIKAGGNEYVSTLSDCGGDKDKFYLGNAALERDQSSPFVLTIAALNAQGISSSYSTPGANLWISAPGGEFGTNSPALTTTDLEGCDKGFSQNQGFGLNDFDLGGESNPNCHYTSMMNGTSSAAPIVSGAIALLLESNPHLTWREIRYLLALSARKVDHFRGPTSHPLGDDLRGHTYLEGWTTNGAGLNFHNWYGFGALNLDAARTMAEGFISPFSGPFESSEWRDDSGILQREIPDNDSDGLEHVIHVQTNKLIEAVQVRLSIEHSMAQDLGVELTSPSGMKSQLLLINSRILDTSIQDEVLLTNAFLGESSQGNWTLKVIDGSPGDTGTLINWKLNFWGGLHGGQVASALKTKKVVTKEESSLSLGQVRVSNVELKSFSSSSMYHPVLNHMSRSLSQRVIASHQESGQTALRTLMKNEHGHEVRLLREKTEWIKNINVPSDAQVHKMVSSSKQDGRTFVVVSRENKFSLLSYSSRYDLVDEYELPVGSHLVDFISYQKGVVAILKNKKQQWIYSFDEDLKVIKKLAWNNQGQLLKAAGLGNDIVLAGETKVDLFGKSGGNGDVFFVVLDKDLQKKRAHQLGLRYRPGSVGHDQIMSLQEIDRRHFAFLIKSDEPWSRFNHSFILGVFHSQLENAEFVQLESTLLEEGQLELLNLATYKDNLYLYMENNGVVKEVAIPLQRKGGAP